MKKIVRSFFYTLGLIRFIPHIFVYYLHPKHAFLKRERDEWIKQIKNVNEFNVRNHLWLFSVLREYRSVFYHRIGFISILLKPFASSQNSLQFDTCSDNIGVGFVIQHGFSTIVNAKSVGDFVQIWQNVTIGVNISHTQNKPIIGNNVKICTGAIVLSNIEIGDNVTIGAGAVVVKNVPPNCTVVGNPAYIIKKDNAKVHEKL